MVRIASLVSRGGESIDVVRELDEGKSRNVEGFSCIGNVLGVMGLESAWDLIAAIES